MTLNGINTMTLQAGGNIGGQIPDVGSAAEVTVDHTAVSAELPTGGVRINFIPRDGGNRFAAATFFTFTNGGLAEQQLHRRAESCRLGDAERDQEELGPQRVRRRADQAGQGLVLVLDRVTSASKTGRRCSRTLNAYKPTECLYVPGHRARAPGGPFLQQQPAGDVAGDAAKQDRRHLQAGHVVRLSERDHARSWRPRRRATSASRVLRQKHVEWTSPVTSRMLVEAVGMHLYERWGFMHLQASTGSSPRVRDRSRRR